VCGKATLLRRPSISDRIESDRKARENQAKQANQGDEAAVHERRKEALGKGETHFGRAKKEADAAKKRAKQASAHDKYLARDRFKNDRAVEEVSLLVD